MSNQNLEETVKRWVHGEKSAFDLMYSDLDRIVALHGGADSDGLAAPTLPHAPRPHDMPPKWDGHRVLWEGWEVPPASTMRFHAKPECCRFCGSLAEPLFNRGRVWSNPGEVTPFRRPKSYEEAAFNQRARRDGSCLGSLFAFRCPDCRHDSVLEGSRGDLFDLDDSDYTDDGS